MYVFDAFRLARARLSRHRAAKDDVCLRDGGRQHLEAGLGGADDGSTRVECADLERERSVDRHLWFPRTSSVAR